MGESERALTIEELADLVGVPVRTIRYYITEGLLPGPGTRGKGTVYSEEHLRRLRLIRVLADRRVPLAQVREQMATLSPPEIDSLLEEEERRARVVERAAVSRSPKQYLSSLLEQARARRPEAFAEPRAPLAPTPDASSAPRWQEPAWRGTQAAEAQAAWYRYELEPGVELHVRADVSERHRDLVERVLAAVRGRTSGAR